MNAALMFVLIAVICLIGVMAGRKVTSAAQWANGGKNLNWVTVGILLVTFQIGGTSTIGAAQNGYVYGIAGIWYGVTGTAAMLLSSCSSPASENTSPRTQLPTLWRTDTPRA